jgi:hypothetical protein
MAGSYVPAPPTSEPQRDHDALDVVAQLARRLAEADGLDDLLQRIVDLGDEPTGYRTE